MAPEVFRNEEYDTKVDVFSFAIILQEVMNGLNAFSFVIDVYMYDIDLRDVLKT